MPLSMEERQAAKEEADAKRQKKEEEKQRILRLGEQDRKAREERNGSATASSENAASASPVAPVQAAKPTRPESTSVRLQIRCPHWSRVIVFTCFTPDSTLSEVAQALREELISGLIGSGDGRAPSDTPAAAAAQARVPQVDAIVFVETVPPRKRWASAEDMQQTLRSAGLCPASSILAEAIPIEPPQVAELAQAAAVNGLDFDAPSNTQHVGEEVEGKEEDEEEEDGTDEQDDSSMHGKGNSGKGSLGKEFFTIPMGLGSRSAAAQPAPGPSAKGKGKGLDDPDDDEDSEGSDEDDADDMMPGKGFSGKGKGQSKGPQPHQFPEGGQTLGSTGGSITGGSLAAIGGAALAATPNAARDARLAALARRGLEPSAQQAEAPKAASAAPRAVMGEPGQNRAERAKERELILQRMQEDREDREIRKQVVPAAATHAPQEKSQVRLQIRCPVSKRVHIATGFTPESLLSAVRSSAAAELGVEDPVMSLAYPPWKEFTAEQCEQSLSALDLCHSATLLIKSANAGTAAVVAEGDGVAPSVDAPVSASGDSAEKPP